MAAKYRKIDPRIWSDEGFSKMDAEHKVVALWMLTGTRVNRCGIVMWSAGLASEETGVDRHRVETVCDTVCDTLNWIRDRVSKAIFLPKWWRYNSPDNVSALKGALSDLHDIPRNGLRSYLIKACDYLPKHLHTVYLELIDTVSDTVCDTVHDTVSPQEQEQEQELSNKETLSGEDCSEDVSDASEPTSDDPSVLEFPTVGTGTKTWHLKQSKLTQYQESFPGIDVLGELRKARQWCIDSPKRRKTPGGMPSFLTRWLGKSQNENRGSTNGRSGSVGQSEPGRYRTSEHDGLPDRSANIAEILKKGSPP
jgi:hypothetical protein